MKLDFNFNFPLVDLDGKEIEGTNIGKVLAQQLMQSTKGDAVKFFELALDLHKGKVVALDTSDQTTIKDFVKNLETLTNLAKAQILSIFDKAKSK